MPRASSRLLLGALLALAAPRAAQAAPADAAATAEFDQGRALMKEKKYTEACAAFEASQKLDPAMGTLYNLAQCHVQIGKLATAWAEYRDLEQRDRDAARARDSGKRAKALVTRLPKLRIDVATKPPGLAVKLDGADVTVLVGTDAPVDLGMHTIDATAPGFVDVHQTAAIDTEGRTTTIPIELAKPVVAKAPKQPEPAPVTEAAAPPDHSRLEEPVEPPPPRGHRTAGFVLAGAGVALVGTAVVFGALANSKWGSAKDLCGPDLMCDNSGMLAQGKALVSDARGKAQLATGFAAGGAVAIGVGVALVIMAPKAGAAHTEDSAWHVTPALAPSTVGLALDGRF